MGTTECKDLPSQEDRDKFETKCRNVCIEGHPDREQMISHLKRYFKLADKDGNGTIEENEFDTLIEYTAEDARRHGFVPSLEVLFDGKIDKILEFRKKNFKAMQATSGEKKGQITIDSYINWTLNHIKRKVCEDLDNPKNRKTEEGARMEATDFVKGFKKVVNGSSSWENALKDYKSMFEDACEDFTDKSGKKTRGLKFAKFNVMIEIFAEKPRVLGLVPKMTDLYHSSEELLSEREKLFKKISGGQSHMTYEQFNKWLVAHLQEKIAHVKVDVIQRI